MNNKNSTIKVDPVPTRKELFEPVFQAIHLLGGSATNGEIANGVIDSLQLTDEVLQIPHGKGARSEFIYRLDWAKSYLKNSELITNSGRGVWSLTLKGRDLENIDVEQIYRYKKQKGISQIDKGPIEDEEFDEESELLSEDAWRQELLEILQRLEPAAFERLCQRILRESGFIEVQVTGKSNDGGIDGKGQIRFAGLVSFPVLFQCKRYKDNVSVGLVRDFRGAMQGRTDRGLFLTTGGFTVEAKKEAARDGAPPIDLIDGDLLLDHLKTLKLGVRTKIVELIEVDSGWFDSL